MFGYAILLTILIKSQAQTAHYNETEAKMLLNLAAGAYGDDANRQECVSRALPMAENHLLLTNVTERCDILGNICQAYVVATDNLRQLTVVFRGTKTTSQLLLEGWTTLQPGTEFYGIGEVNRYFASGHELLWPTIYKIITSQQYQSYNIFFTGHSLGAALASLAAARTVSQGYRQSNQVKVVTFGQPRVGNQYYAKNFDRLIPYSFRVVNQRDVVPHMPGCAKDPFYQSPDDSKSKPCDPNNYDKAYHHGTEVWYPDSMAAGSRYIVCTGLPKGEDFGCSDIYRFNLSETSDLIYDHRHYFDVEVPDFGKTGCDPNLPLGADGGQTNGLLDSVAGFVSKVFG